jgi:thiamine-phosphate pyrophosphorylase
VILCLVTDRRRLCGERASVEVCRHGLAEQARAAVRAGIDWIEVRERDLESADLAAIVSELVRESRGTGTRILVNDRLDVALACGADGVHLRGDSMPAAAVRRVASRGFLVGRSVHSVEEAQASGPVDYLIAGTVFPTPSKASDAPLLGPAGLRRIVRAAGVPVLGIGGIDVGRAAAVAEQGSAGIAAIGLFVAPDGAPCHVMPLDVVAGAVRAAFDSVHPGS